MEGGKAEQERTKEEDEGRAHLFDEQIYKRIDKKKKRKRKKRCSRDTRTLECMCVANMKAGKSVRASNNSSSSSSNPGSSSKYNSNSHYM